MSKFTTVLNGFRNSMNSWQLGLMFCLAFIHERSQAGLDTQVTDLTRSLTFGTGPTVHRKLRDLQAIELIEIKASASDKRAKTITVTANGLKKIKEADELMAKWFA